MDFNSGPPVALTNSPMYTDEGCSSVCDATGSLLFFTGGVPQSNISFCYINVFDANLNLMPNGDSLYSSVSGSQNSQIVRDPGNPNMYYIFTAGAGTSSNTCPGDPCTYAFSYSVVDMTLNAGMGDVVAGMKNIILPTTPIGEKIAVTKHANGCDIWVLTHNSSNQSTANPGTTFYAYLVTAGGISAPVTTTIGMNHWDVRGYMTISPNGQRLVVSAFYSGVELYDFNNSNGVISNVNILITGNQSNTPSSYGNAFSPNNDVVYVSEWGVGVHQYDATNANPASTNLIVSPAGGQISALSLGPDGKIYGTRNGLASLHVINNPDVLGAGCNWASNAFSLAGQAPHHGLPQMVVIGGAAVANIIGPTNICVGDSAQLIATGGTTYLWSTGDSSYTITVAPGSTTTYSITVSNGGCSGTDSFTVNVVTSVTAAISGNTNICSGNSTTLTASGGTSFLWNTGDTTATISITPGSSSIYFVTVSSGSCNDVDSINVTVNAPPAAGISSQSNVLCFNGNNGAASASATGGTAPYTYFWSNSQTTQTSSGLIAGTYSVTVTDANGCSDTTTVSITQPAPIIVTTSSTPSGCTVNNGTATATPSGGTVPYTYLWNNAQTTQTATGLGAGTYTVTVTDANGCTITQNIIVIIDNSLTVSMSSTQAGCNANNGTATATPSGGNGPYTYSWSNGQTTQTAVGLGAGTFTVTVTDANGCTITQLISVTAIVGTTATATASVTNITPGGYSQLNSSGGGSYQWSPMTGLNCSNCQNPVATPAVTTSYCVVVTDTNGCSDSACVVIFVDVPCGGDFLNTIMPNAFSPDNNGQNDQLCIPQSPCIVSASISIYDRWGEKVFESTDINHCWDGTHKGKELNKAVFIYVLEAVLSNGETFRQKGNISLIR